MPFNVKTSGIIAFAAFILSFLLGLISGGGVFWVLIRALIFGAAFFALVSAGQVLIDRFLLSSNDELSEQPAPGSVIDISVDDAGVTGAPDDASGVAGASLEELLAQVGDTKQDEKEGEADQNKIDAIKALQAESAPEAGDNASEQQDAAASEEADKKQKKMGTYAPKDLASAISTMLNKPQ
ncbi:MAG: hypothetical protein LBS86_06455 [Treponema sp.]|jgi:hypothetical protein|nr:hypothetical protein [Treponema sp.]